MTGSKEASSWPDVRSSEPYRKNLVVLRHTREFNDISSKSLQVKPYCQQTSTVSAIPLLLLKQYRCCRGFNLDTNSQFYNYEEPLDKKKSIFG